MTDFESFFHTITDRWPYRYQRELAEVPMNDCLIRIPTGCGKTAAVIAAWLWRIKQQPRATPKRLIYCLPMRVLVEQTAKLANVWAYKSGTAARVSPLMGGEIDEGWEFDPDRPTILVGTQDMLLSRALNRGYAMSRYRWPVHFGLLNNDCLWVCDEVQLMGNGLGTTAQMQSFRDSWETFGPTATWWMSATADREWLKTVDYQERASALKVVELEAADRTGDLGAVCRAAKPLSRIEKLDGKTVEALHRPGSLTLVVLNTVGRARDLYESLRSPGPEGTPRKKKQGVEQKRGTEVLLVHSRFRPPDRKRIVARLLAADNALRGEPLGGDQQDPAWLDCVRETGLIVVSTQVVEAGVDLSAETLITELAPWASIVQRLGRCNRRGKQDGTAKVRWVALPDKQALPYEPERLAESRAILEHLSDGSIASLAATGPLPAMEFTHVIRRHDIHGLFSTEPDLAGGFTEISAYVRDAEADTSVYVFWRNKAEDDAGAPQADEICPVSVGDFIVFLKSGNAEAREWNGETETWERRRPGDVRPGMTLLLDRTAGGYRDDLGWTGDSDHKPSVTNEPGPSPDGVGRDSWSATDWNLLTAHLREAESEARKLVDRIGLGIIPEGAALTLASLWHDVGKNHPRWRDAVPTEGQPGIGPWAKFPRVAGGRFRPRIRHEAASALVCFDHWQALKPGWSALAVYLVAAHHGKVRTVLRSRGAGAANVFGICTGDLLPPLVGWLEAEYEFNLACRAFGAPGGWSEDDGSFDQASPSWVGMVAELLGPEAPGDAAPTDAIPETEPRHLGPFRLAYLEALAVAVDVRASGGNVAGGAK